MPINDTFKQHDSLYKSLIKQYINCYNEIYETSIITQNKKDLSFLERVIDAKKIQLSDEVLKFKKLYKNNGQDAGDIEVQTSFKFLSEVLHRHYGRKVYILIDE